MIKNDYVIYYNTYDREYDERGIIDIYESNVIGAKYNFSNNFNDEISSDLDLNTNMNGDT